MKKLEYIIENALKRFMEQAPPVAKETDNALSDAEDSPFTPAEEKFLGKFDAYGTTHIGIIYSISDIGIREFITRSGADLNISPDILISLLRKKTIKLVPYTGWGNNNDYTIELQLSLDDVKGLGAEDKAKAETGSTAAGAPAPGGSTPPPPGPGPEVAWVIPYGELIRESTTIAKQLISEKAKKKNPESTVYVDKSRVLKRLPKGYITQLERIIDMMGKHAHTAHEKQRIVADILDNLAVNLKLTDKQIRKSFEFYKNQNKLKSVIDDINENTDLMLESYVIVESREHIDYLTKKGFAPYINNAFQFWDKIPGAIDNGMIMTNYSEDVFFSVINKYLIKSSVGNKRKQAITIDAISKIHELASQQSDSKDREAAIDFCKDWFSQWSLMELPLVVSGYKLVSIDEILNNDLIYDFVIKSSTDYDSTKQTKALKDSLNKLHIGYLDTTEIDIVRPKVFTPTYSNADTSKIVGELLAPYKSKVTTDAAGHKKLKTTYVDTLTDAEKVARGKFALVQIAKRVNSFNPKAETKWTRSTDGKSWVDSKGVGVYIISSPNDKALIYSDGTLKLYDKQGILKSTTKWKAEYDIDKKYGNGWLLTYPGAQLSLR
jgi:hypothetical protein